MRSSGKEILQEPTLDTPDTEPISLRNDFLQNTFEKDFKVPKDQNSSLKPKTAISQDQKEETQLVSYYQIKFPCQRILFSCCFYFIFPAFF